MSVEAMRGLAPPWPSTANDEAAPATVEVATGVAVPGTGDVVADRALELLMAAEADLADDGVHTAASAVRQATERRIEQRAKLRELMRRIQEAQQNRSWWQKFCDAFGWVGKILGAIGGVVAVVATAGIALPAALGIGLAVGAGTAGLTSALGRLGVGAAERDAANLSADRLQEEGNLAAWEEYGRDGRALAEALVGLESAMREQALRWIGNEDEARRLGASMVLDR
ncbi:MAG: hypothetical protein JXB32_17435 [Deltaproteobacteria bacterium]|nr:hypothetical protein [Deltaproteobacteria bacterium]